jgi:hypothetical protein
MFTITKNTILILLETLIAKILFLSFCLNIERLIFALAVCIIMTSCSGSLDKPIFKSLTIEELKDAIKKDSLFEETYKQVQYAKDSILKTDIEKAKWADLTYSRIFRLVKFSNDTVYFKPINEKLKKEWAEKYGKLLTRVDSISNYWKKYKEENSLDQYVKIELVEIDKEYYTYIGGIRDINLGFRLTPLKGAVDQLRFGYRIEPKLYEEKDNDPIYTAWDNSWCLTTTPFSSPVVRFWEVGYSNKNALEQKTIETFKRDYNIFIDVDQLRKDGINLKADDLKIPESIKKHWRYEKQQYLEDLYADEVAKELLNEEYMPEYEYLSDQKIKMLKKKDSLSYEFLRLRKD